jgi:uncharacterized membrane protein HdeD (DUF308 family)
LRALGSIGGAVLVGSIWLFLGWFEVIRYASNHTDDGPTCYRAVPEMALLFEILVFAGLGAVLLTGALAARAALTGRPSRQTRASALTFAAIVAVFFVVSWTGPDNGGYCSGRPEVSSAAS